MRSSKALIIASLMLALLSGCAAKTEYVRFAQAGSGYAVAVDKLLLVAGEKQVDATSWSLVVEKMTTGMDYETYKKRTQEDTARLQEISRLRTHAKLLGQYFVLLESLATSDAPEQAQTALEGVVGEMNKLKKDLPSQMGAMAPLGKLMLDLEIRRVLSQELEKRKDVIRSHLALHEELLVKLKEQISHALTLNRQSREQTLVIEMLLQDKPLKNPQEWVSTRRRIVQSALSLEELKTAGNLAKTLRLAFESLLKGGMTETRLNALVSDAQGLLALAETLSK